MALGKTQIRGVILARRRDSRRVNLRRVLFVDSSDPPFRLLQGRSISVELLCLYARVKDVATLWSLYMQISLAFLELLLEGLEGLETLKSRRLER